MDDLFNRIDRAIFVHVTDRDWHLKQGSRARAVKSDDSASLLHECKAEIARLRELAGEQVA